MKASLPAPFATPLPKKSRQVEDSPSTAFWDIKAEAKSKGKHVFTESASAGPSPSLRKGKGRAIAAELPPPVTPLPKKSSRRFSAIHAPTQEEASPQADGQLPPRKKRRITIDSSSFEAPSSRQSLRPTPRRETNGQARISTGQTPRGTSSRTGTKDTPATPLPPVKHPILRVRLIVRKPPPVYTHPAQRPPPKAFGGSLDAVLTSFTTRHGYETSAAEIDAELSQELALWRRVDKLRGEGRLVERSSYEFRGREPQDAWAQIVREVGRHTGPWFVDGREMAANVAGKLHKMWQMENQAEEARLKGLAKQTLGEVLEQWRKAVYVSTKCVLSCGGRSWCDIS